MESETQTTEFRTIAKPATMVTETLGSGGELAEMENEPLLLNESLSSDAGRAGSSSSQAEAALSVSTKVTLLSALDVSDEEDRRSLDEDSETVPPPFSQHDTVFMREDLRQRIKRDSEKDSENSEPERHGHKSTCSNGDSNSRITQDSTEARQASPPGSLSSDSQEERSRLLSEEPVVGPDHGHNSSSNCLDSSEHVTSEVPASRRTARSFSVVPVDNPKNSPNSNLGYLNKKKFKSITQVHAADSDVDSEAETLLASSNLKEFLASKSLSSRNVHPLHDDNADSGKSSTHPESKDTRVTPMETRKRNSNGAIEEKPPEETVKTPEALMAPWRQFNKDPAQPGHSKAGPSKTEPSKAGPSQPGPSKAGPSQPGPSRAGHSKPQQQSLQIQKLKKLQRLQLEKQKVEKQQQENSDRMKRNMTLPSFCRPDASAAATQFPRVEYNSPETTSMPIHYLTVSNVSGLPVVTKSHYLTVQPTRHRCTPDNYARSNFLTTDENGQKSIEFGYTDGKNINLTGRARISSESFRGSHPSFNNLQTVTSLGALSTGGQQVAVGSASGCGSHPLLEMYDADEHPLEKSHDSQDKEEGVRATWGSKLKFVLACIGSCVGLGNFWRFPYLCYKSGGGAFLLPYTLMLFVCGIPLLLMEMAIGQYTRQGPIGAMLCLCPIFIGSAVGVVVISTIFCSYYNVIISWSVFYLVQSMQSQLPWTVGCEPGLNSSMPGGHMCDKPDNVSATQYYFDTVVLQKSIGIEDFGGMVWPLLGCVFVAWFIVYFSIWKSIKSSGMVVLVTATLPYVLIAIFLVRAVTLDGAGEGLKFLFYPDWSLLLDVKVWVNAAAQNFNSIGIGFGSMITFSSYNKFSNNLLQDVWIIALINAATSLFAGIIVFSTMGNIAFELDRNITDVVAEGPGLAFVVYPQALAKMPSPNLFSILFFLLLIILGIDSQFATVEVIVTSLQDAFPNWIKKKLKRHEILALVVCLCCFTMGLPNIFNGGIYYFNLLDYYSAAISLMYLAFFEVVAVVWCYGASRLSKNLREMTGKLPSQYFYYCWMYLSPLLITVIAIASWIDYQEPTYNQGSYFYPPWAIAMGWIIACLSIVPIPVGMVIMTYRAKGDSLWQKVKTAASPRIKECDRCYKSLHNPDSPCRCCPYTPGSVYPSHPLSVRGMSAADNNCTNGMNRPAQV